jgi:hypothetical protein
VVLRLDRFKDVIEMCRTITKFSSQESIDHKDCMFVVEFDCFNHDYIKRSDTGCWEEDVETASIETSVVMVDTKATKQREHEAKKSALEPC